MGKNRELKLKGRYHDHVIRVRYEETDRMGVTYYGNYFVYFEIGRSEFSRASGFSYRDVEEEAKVYLAVVETWCRYLSSVSYDDEIIIRTYLNIAKPLLIIFEYELLKKDSGKVFAYGNTVHIPVGEDGRKKEMPDKFLNLLSGYAFGEK